MKNDSIDKLNEQIDSLLSEEKKEEDVLDHEISDEKVEEVLEEDATKKIDAIEDIETEEKMEKTKKIDVVEDVVVEEEKEESEVKEDTVEDKKDEVEEDKKEEKKDEEVLTNKNKLKIVFIISGVALLCLIFLIIFLIPSKSNKTSKVDDTKKSSKVDYKEVIEGYGDAIKGLVGVTYEKDKKILTYDEAIKLVKYDYKVVCKDHEIYEDGLVYLDKCSVNGKDVKYTYGKKQEKKEEPKISEDAIKVYVSKKGGKATLDKVKNEDDYDIYYFEIDGKYSGLTLLSSTSDYVFYADEDYNTHMINFKTGNKIFESMNYSSVLPIKLDEVYDTDYVAVCINNKWGIYKISNNERVVSHKYDTVTPLLYMGTSGPSFEVNALDDGVVAAANYGYNGSEYGLVNYHNGTEIIKVEYKNMLKSGKYLFATDYYGDGHVFDYSGKEYLANKYDELYWAVDGKYVLVKDGKNIKVVNVSGKELYDYGEVNVEKINYGLTYKDGAVFQFDNPEKDENNTDTHCIEVIYDSSSKSGEVKTSYCGGIAKPILYLYPKKTTKVEITFEHPEYLETTYPKFTGKWEVTAHKNGDLYDNKDNYYYGLYWDEKRIHEVDFSEGYYVEKNDAIEFLEKKLSYIGLSPREKNEFIMYWLPILEKNEKSLVYFELTDERESYSKINITPKPDSLLRLVIHIKKVNEKIDIKKQNLTKFQRKGFVAVEWGGVNY